MEWWAALGLLLAGVAGGALFMGLATVTGKVEAYENGYKDGYTQGCNDLRERIRSWAKV